MSEMVSLRWETAPILLAIGGAVWLGLRDRSGEEMRVAMKSASPKEVPARAFELARALEKRLGMPATRYMTSRESTSRRAPRTGTVVPARSIPAAASPEAQPAGPLNRHPGRRLGRSIESGEVAGAILTALRFGLLATGLGWLVAGLF